MVQSISEYRQDVASKIDRLSLSLKKLVLCGAEFLCQAGRNGSWGDVRINSSAIWALTDLGFAEKHREFMEYAVKKLLKQSEIVKDIGLCFNHEVWDSSLALIAISKVDGIKYSEEIKGIRSWILSEFKENEKLD